MEAGSRTRDVMPLRWRIASHAHLVALGESRQPATAGRDRVIEE